MTHPSRPRDWKPVVCPGCGLAGTPRPDGACRRCARDLSMVRPPEAPAGNPLGTAIVAVIVVTVIAVLAVAVGGVSEAFEGPSHEGETLRAEKERPEYIEVPGPVRQPR